MKIAFVMIKILIITIYLISYHNLLYGDQTFKTTDNYLFHQASIYDFLI